MRVLYLAAIVSTRELREERRPHLTSHCGVVWTDDDQRRRNVETLQVREATQL